MGSKYATILFFEGKSLSPRFRAPLFTRPLSSGGGLFSLVPPQRPACGKVCIRSGFYIALFGKKLIIYGIKRSINLS